MIKDLKIAFIHDWLVGKGGAENTLEAMLALWPGAPVYTLVHDLAGACGSFLKGHSVYTSFLQKFPMAIRKYRSYLPFMPLAIEQFDLSEYDVIISSSHAVAKGVLTSPDQLHITYCHTPIRYAWDLQHQYLKMSGKDRGLKGIIARLILHEIRKWDYRTANGVDYFVANSNFISRRIWKVYRRQAKVIHPPVDVDAFSFSDNKEDFYITASRMVPYKRIDVIVCAFAKMPDKQLVVIGDGPDYEEIKKLSGPNIQFLGYKPHNELRDYFQRAKGFIFAAKEDFGIVPVEAQACGTPVIAFGQGGALETVIDGKTGIFFDEQTPESLVDAVVQFEEKYTSFDLHEIRKHAESFSKKRFQEEILKFIEKKVVENKP